MRRPLSVLMVPSEITLISAAPAPLFSEKFPFGGCAPLQLCSAEKLQIGFYVSKFYFEVDSRIKESAQTVVSVTSF